MKKNYMPLKNAFCTLALGAFLFAGAQNLAAQETASDETALPETAPGETAPPEIAPGETAPQEPPVTESVPSKPRNPLLPSTMYVTLGAIGILNAADPTQSAPSPILFTPGFGAGWNVYSGLVGVDVEGRLSFFMNYYLWRNENALPAEIEHLVAFVTSIVLDIPVMVSFKLGPHAFRAGAGIAFVPRLSFLAWNADMGHPEAQDEVKEIGSWFFEKARFIYPEIVAGWDTALNNGWRAGLELRAYIPMANGAAVDENALDGGMMSIAVKLIFP
jgi:hypothetical protein